MMPDQHSENLAYLHSQLLQLYADFLDRLRGEGIVSDAALHNGLAGFLDGTFTLKFTATITPEMLHLVCEAGSRQIFNADLAVGAMAADQPRH